MRTHEFATRWSPASAAEECPRLHEGLATMLEPDGVAEARAVLTAAPRDATWSSKR